MVKLLGFRLCISALVAFVLFITAAAGGENLSSMPIDKAVNCRGSIGECIADDGVGEFDVDSESNRRILGTTNYISYGALRANNVPCSYRGASYYNCRPGAQANPYTRSCTAATRCRS